MHLLAITSSTLTLVLIQIWKRNKDREELIKITNIIVFLIPVPIQRLINCLARSKHSQISHNYIRVDRLRWILRRLVRRVLLQQDMESLKLKTTPLVTIFTLTWLISNRSLDK